MKVFVTGHRGYIGAHLVDLLKQMGHTVTGCDLGWGMSATISAPLAGFFMDAGCSSAAGVWRRYRPLRHKGVGRGRPLSW